MVDGAVSDRSPPKRGVLGDFFPQQTYFKMEVTDFTRRMRTQHIHQRAPVTAPAQHLQSVLDIG